MNPRPLPAEGSQSAFALSLATGLLAISTPALAQTLPPGIVFNPIQFSSCSTLVDFESYTVATQISSAPGVTFSLSDGGSPWSGSVGIVRQFPLVSPAQGPLVLQNFAPGTNPLGASPDLIMDFDSPINKVGFEVLQVDGMISLTLRCFFAGSLIGTDSFTVNDFSQFHFLGLSSRSVFDRVEVAISNSTGGGNHRFWVDNLRFEGPPAVTIATAPRTVFQTSTAFLDFDVTHVCPTTVTSSPAGLNLSLPAGSNLLSLQPIPMVEGLNTLSITAADSLGNTGGASVQVISDTIAPLVAFLLPAGSANRLVVGETPVEVSVEVEDATSTTVFYGGGTFSRFGGTHIFTASFSLVEGSQTRNITVIDKAFHETLRTIELVLDLDAPLVVINTPTDGAIFGPGLVGAAIPLTATVNDLTATTVSSNPSGMWETGLPGGGIVSGTIVLSEGINPIVVTAQDEAGHLGSSPSIFVILDTTAPTAVVSSPSDGEVVGGVIDFDALVSDASPGSGIAQVEFLVNGIPFGSPITAPPYGTLVDTTLLSDGSHFFSVVVTDGAGNSSSDLVTAIVDNAPPVITILSPFDGELVGGTIFFDAVISSAGAGVVGVRTRVAGGPPNIQDGSLAFILPVASTTVSSLDDTALRMDGSLDLKVVAFDAAGNQALQEIAVIVDNSSPSKCLKSPRNGKTVKGVVKIVAETQNPGSTSIEVLIDGVSLGEVFATSNVWLFDTLARHDGSMAITAIERGPANRQACTARVTVDNIKFDIHPRKLKLKRPKGKPMTVELKGLNPTVLLPIASHTIQLLVPGAAPISAFSLDPGEDEDDDDNDEDNDDNDEDNDDKLRLTFDGALMVEAVRAGIAAGLIEDNKHFDVTLVADGFEVGTRKFKVKFD